MSALFDYVLRLGDDSLVLGQRLAEWCGHAPALEIDLSLANISLDLIGQATHFLNYAGAIEGKGRDGDALAFGRDVYDFRNCLLVEQPNGDFAQTIARQFLFSTWHLLQLRQLSRSADATLAGIASKAAKEVSYHAEIATDWVVRLGDGTQESHARMTDGLAWNWRFVGELFEDQDIDGQLLAAGVAVDASTIRAGYDAMVAATLARATLDLPTPHRTISGGRRGRHSEHLGHMLSEMQFLQRAYPGASW